MANHVYIKQNRNVFRRPSSSLSSKAYLIAKVQAKVIGANASLILVHL